MTITEILINCDSHIILTGPCKSNFWKQQSRTFAWNAQQHCVLYATWL